MMCFCRHLTKKPNKKQTKKKTNKPNDIRLRESNSAKM